MADENTVPNIQFFRDQDQVIGKAFQAGVTGGIIAAQIGPPGAHEIKQDDLERILEGRSHEAPHVLVTAEAMGENHRARARAADFYIVTRTGGHPVLLGQ